MQLDDGRESPKRRTEGNLLIHLTSLFFVLLLYCSHPVSSFSTTEYQSRSPYLVDREHRIRLRHQNFQFSAKGGNIIDEQNPMSQISTKRNTRAGQDGYSLLRQPLQRDTWDSSNDLRYRTPKKLDDDGVRTDTINSDWWSSRRTGSGDSDTMRSSYSRGSSVTFDRLASSTPTPSPITTEDQTLDLFQRSSDTLDFPLILAGLRAQCYTIPAKEIVDEAADQSEKKHHVEKKKKS